MCFIILKNNFCTFQAYQLATGTGNVQFAGKSLTENDFTVQVCQLGRKKCINGEAL